MASSSPAEEGDSTAAAVPVKDAAFVAGTTVRRPGRLRVIHPHVAALLRPSSSRRHARPPSPPAPKPSPPQPTPNPERARYACAFDAGDVAGGTVAAPGSLVWGKVRRHPWWPGQVFDLADASPSARALLRRPSRAGGSGADVLVAYFWDKTFAWHNHHHHHNTTTSPSSSLLPFRAGFPRLAATAPVAAAVAAALREVSRRVSAGLSCSCRPSHLTTTNDNNNFRQVIDNAGVRDGAYGAPVDAAFARGALQGEKLVGYLSALATSPLAAGGAADRVDLAVAAAQIEALGRWRGAARGLPVYTLLHGIDGVVVSAAPNKRKRSSASTASKRRTRVTRKKIASDDGDGDYEALEMEDLPLPAVPLQQVMSMKVGKRISRAARQMSMWPVILRANGSSSFPLPPPQAAVSVSSPSPAPHMERCPVSKKKKKQSNGGGGEHDEEAGAGLVLNFKSATAVPSAGHLAGIFGRFGPVKEVRAENATAMVVFGNGKHADDAFAGTAKIGGSFSASLISFRVTSSLLPPPAPAAAAQVQVVDLDPPPPQQSMSLDASFVEALLQY